MTEKQVSIRRSGYNVDVRLSSNVCILDFGRALPAGPDDWMEWIEHTLSIEFGHSTEVVNPKPVEGTIRLTNRGGSRSSIKMWDTKPKAVHDGAELN